jgi:LPS sulfotransferase NodH
MAEALDHPPTVVIGMHRSGTGLLTELLDELGLFVGARLDSSHESLFFQTLNRWLLDQARCSWDRPEEFDELLEDSKLRALSADYLDSVLGSPRAASYIGLTGLLRGQDPRKLEGPWGWKDPRNTFTLPLWEDVIGPVQIVHIVRHGVDIADSLRRRRQHRLERRSQLFRRFEPLAWLPLPRDRFAESTRTASLEGGFTLWEAYVDRAREHVENARAEAVEIRYETLLEDPHRVLQSLAEDIGLDPTPKIIDAAADRIHPDRAYAYRDDDELTDFARKRADRLNDYGYEP